MEVTVTLTGQEPNYDLSFKQMVKEEGIYVPESDDTARIIVVLNDELGGYVLYASDGALEPLERKLWAHDNFRKTKEKLELIFK